MNPAVGSAGPTAQRSFEFAVQITVEAEEAKVRPEIASLHSSDAVGVKFGAL